MVAASGEVCLTEWQFMAVNEISLLGKVWDHLSQHAVRIWEFEANDEADLTARESPFRPLTRQAVTRPTVRAPDAP